MKYNKGDYMARLVREQKIERRIAQHQRDLYATTSRNYEIPHKKERLMLNFAHTFRATSTGMYSYPFLAERNRSTSQGWGDRILNKWHALLDCLIEKATNADLCYVLGLFLATITLSFSFQSSGLISNYASQPVILPLTSQLATQDVSFEINRQPIAISSAITEDANDFQAFQTEQYTVQSGQTLSELSQLHNISMSTLVSFNKITNARSLRAGSVYSVPDREGLLRTVKAGETLEQIAAQNNITTNELLDVNNLASASLTSGQELFIPGAGLGDFDLRVALGELFTRPVYGRTTSGFGYRPDPFTGVRRFHYGLDIAAPTGTPILASMEGRVSYVDEQQRGYGKYIIIRHPGGFQSLYAHLNGFNVRVGQFVSRGQTIGWIGNTGRSTGPHLHFSIIHNGRFVSPTDYLY